MRLHNAVRWGNPHALLLLCQIDEIDKKNGQGKTPLHVAAELGDSNAVLCLLREGADPEMQDLQGRKPRECTIDRQIINIFNQYQEEI